MKSKKFFNTKLAYFIYIARGRKPSTTLNNWLAAEWVVQMFLPVAICFFLFFAYGHIKKHGGDVSVSVFGIAVKATLTGPPGQPEMPAKREVIANPINLNSNEVFEKISDSINTQKSQDNLINNGNFEIPFANPFSNWGFGFYSDQYNFSNQRKERIIWLNFLNAEINIDVEKTTQGNALKIMHISPTQNHRIGVMEQYIDVVPGRYRLSFMAKAASDAEVGSVQLFTKNNWRIYEEDGVTQRGIEITQKGPFEWQRFAGEIKIDNPGKQTFSIVSAKRGTVWITDISLIKIED